MGWISWVAGTSGSSSSASGSYLKVAGDGSAQQGTLPAMDDIKGFALSGGNVAIAAITLMRGPDKIPEQFALKALDRRQRSWSPVLVPGMPSMTGKALLGGSAEALAIWDVVAKRISFSSAN